MLISELEAEERRILERLEEIGRAKRNLSQLTPNAETIAALQEADAGGGEQLSGSTEEIFASIVGQSPRTT